jgi:Tol biopolymer transport system component
VRLTSGPESESSPRWSPDGRYLAFLASRGTEDEKKKGSQIWLLDRLGGEAQKLTEIDGGVSDYSWSPDSKKFVFTKSDKDPADEPEKMEGWKRKTAPPIVLDRYHFKQDRDGYLKRFYRSRPDSSTIRRPHGHLTGRRLRLSARARARTRTVTRTRTSTWWTPGPGPSRSS